MAGTPTTAEGRPAPGVWLRPVADGDLAFLDHLSSPAVAGEFNHFDDPERETLRAGDVGAGRMIVVAGEPAGHGCPTAGPASGLPVGDVSWFGVPYGPNRRSLAWRIGVTIDLHCRRRGYGAAAQRLLAEHLLATTPSRRIEADTDVANVAERRALERAGFSLEGVLRQAQYRGGAWHDVALYAFLG